ncbi:MAG: hypothetical protein ABJO97_00440 [Roseibium sp.]|uniref:hypothetical protein n=1 Tax=Roseibium sp. TaxID=1936156 RepID=UPI0032641656
MRPAVCFNFWLRGQKIAELQADFPSMRENGLDQSPKVSWPYIHLNWHCSIDEQWYGDFVGGWKTCLLFEQLPLRN